MQLAYLTNQSDISKAQDLTCYWWCNACQKAHAYSKMGDGALDPLYPDFDDLSSVLFDVASLKSNNIQYELYTPIGQ